jgi:hypothetical protein
MELLWLPAREALRVASLNCFSISRSCISTCSNRFLPSRDSASNLTRLAQIKQNKNSKVSALVYFLYESQCIRVLLKSRARSLDLRRAHPRPAAAAKPCCLSLGSRAAARRPRARAPAPFPPPRAAAQPPLAQRSRSQAAGALSARALQYTGPWHLTGTPRGPVPGRCKEHAN